MVMDFPDMGGNICVDEWAKLLAAVDCPDEAAQPVPASSSGSAPSTAAAQGETIEGLGLDIGLQCICAAVSIPLRIHRAFRCN